MNAHETTTVVELFAGLARHGDRVALDCDGERLTYAQLDARADRVAAALRRLGVAPGERVAFALPTGVEIVAWYVGCARAGVVAMPLPTRLTDEEVVANVGDGGAVLLVHEPGQAERFRALLPRLASVATLLPADDARIATAPTGEEPHVAAPDDLYCLMYTGGSTGAPKAAMQTQGNWASCIRSVAAQWRLTEADRHLLVLPMSHVSWFTVAAHLHAGATTAMMRRWDPAAALALVERERLTVLNMIPTMLSDLVQAADGAGRDLSSVRHLTVAGSPMPVELYHRAVAVFGDVIGAIYGLTETSGPVCFLHAEQMRDATLRSGGRAGDFAEIAIRDDDGGEVAAGERGEIALRGPQVTPGYLGRPAETEAAIVDGWFHTGDVGYLDDDGFLFIVDRKKDMIKSGGYNVYPREVEDVLYAHPDVVEAAVVGLPDRRWIEAVHAVVALRPGSGPEVTEQALIDHARTRLSGYKVPKSVRLVQRLPRTGVNKIDKVALRARLGA